MFVKDYMTRHPIMIAPEMKAAEAQKIMSENKVRHLPVVGDGKRLVGLVTRQRLVLKPDAMASLNVWEITRFLSEMTVRQVMLPAKQVKTINPSNTFERAARILADHKISCLPVLDDDGTVVGILSEVDLLRGIQDMLGMMAEGVRVTMQMPNKEGEFAKLSSIVAEQGWGIMGIGSYPTPRREGYYQMVLKIPRVTVEQVHEVLSRVPDQEIIDIRTVV